LINIFKDWFQRKNGEAPSDVQVRSLTYMENNFFKTNVHMQTNERKARILGEAEGGRPSSPTRINDI
jgi:hypothetical protein